MSGTSVLIVGWNGRGNISTYFWEGRKPFRYIWV